MDECISIIIPVYNLGDCVKQCLHSVLTQSYDNWLLILVDDGSSDSGAALCECFAQADARIIVVHMPNGGVSVARNTGMILASGEFVTFIDGDDVVAPEYLATLRLGMRSDAILALCEEVRITNYGHMFADPTDEFIKLESDECATRILQGRFPVSVWGSLYRRELLQDVHFPAGIRNNEDKQFVFEYLLRNNGMVYAGMDKLYGYLVRDGSASRDGWNGSTDVVDVAMNMLQKGCELHPEWEPLLQANVVGAELAVLKQVVLADVVDNNREEFERIREDALVRADSSQLSKQAQIELCFLKAGRTLYELLVRVYYTMASDYLRMQRNARRIRQFS